MGGNCPGRNCPRHWVGIVRVGTVRVGIVRVGIVLHPTVGVGQWAESRGGNCPEPRGGYRGGGSGGPGPLRRGFWGGPKIVRGEPLRSGRSEGIGAKGGEYVPEGPKLQIFSIFSIFSIQRD